jgi:hypothetical protein
MDKVISQESCFKHQCFDYTGEEPDLPQGHANCIQSVDLLSENKQQHEDEDNNSVLPTDRLECAGELHPLVDFRYALGRFFMGYLKSDHNQFCIRANSHFNNICIDHLVAHGHMELQTANATKGLPPTTGVDNIKIDQKQALTAYTKDQNTFFQAKSKRWLDYTAALNKRYGIAPMESNIQHWPNVLKYVFVPHTG